MSDHELLGSSQRNEHFLSNMREQMLQENLIPIMQYVMGRHVPDDKDLVYCRSYYKNHKPVLAVPHDLVPERVSISSHG